MILLGFILNKCSQKEEKLTKNNILRQKKKMNLAFEQTSLKSKMSGCKEQSSEKCREKKLIIS